MPDNLMTLCDGLVAQLSVQDFGTPAAFAWQDNPFAPLEGVALDTLQGWVVDWAEELDTDRHSVDVEEYGVLVILQEKVPAASGPAAVRSLSAVTSAVARFLRSASVPIGGEAAICYRVQRRSARDLEAYKSEDLFRAEILAHFRRVGDEL